MLSRTQGISGTQLFVGLSVAFVGFLGARAVELMLVDGFYARIGIFGYDPHCYHVIEVASCVVLAFPSVKWKSLAYVATAVGGEELASSVTYTLYHLQSIIANPYQWPLNDYVFPYKVVIYLAVTGVGLYFLKGGVKLSLNWVSFLGLIIYGSVLVTVMALGYPVTALVQYQHDLPLNVLEMSGMAGWLAVVYGGLRPK